MDKDMEMLSVLGKIATALSRSAGHTVEVYKAEESTPPFRVYLTTTEEGDHAVVLVHGTKVTVLPLAKEEPEGLLWHIEVIRKEIAPLEIGAGEIAPRALLDAAGEEILPLVGPRGGAWKCDRRRGDESNDWKAQI